MSASFLPVVTIPVKPLKEWGRISRVWGREGGGGGGGTSPKTNYSALAPGNYERAGPQ